MSLWEGRGGEGRGGEGRGGMGWDVTRAKPGNQLVEYICGRACLCSLYSVYVK